MRILRRPIWKIPSSRSLRIHRERPTTFRALEYVICNAYARMIAKQKGGA